MKRLFRHFQGKLYAQFNRGVIFKRVNISLIILFSVITTFSQTVVKVKIEQSPKLNVNIDNNVYIDNSGTVQLGRTTEVTGGAEPYTYQWVKDGTVISTDKNFDVTSDGNDDFTLVVSDSRGCFIKNQIKIRITDIFSEFSSKLKIYPVPARDHLKIEMPLKGEVYTSSLFDANGKKLWSGEIVDEYILNVNYPAGVYILKFTSKGKTESKRVTISK